MKRFKLSTKLFAASVALGIIIVVSGVVFTMIYTKNHRPTNQEIHQAYPIMNMIGTPSPDDIDSDNEN
jgi:hypothetical protein